jgi:S-layer homology domain
MTLKSLTLAGILALGTFSPLAVSPVSAGQFPDVHPTNWAYQAVLNLRDRYGCAVGFPDGTFRPGNKATRAQLAALVSYCLDNITTYVDEKDAALAQALRSEFRVELSKLNKRVVSLEVATERKERGVGTYVGAGVTVGNRPDLRDVNAEDNTSTYAGIGIQGRFPVLKSGELNAVSLRPYVGFTGSDFGGVVVNGGGTVTYDFSIGNRRLSDGSRVSSTNLYMGAGYGAAQTYGDTLTRTITTQSNAIGVVGVETAVGSRGVLFADVKLPFQRNDVTDSYDLQGIVGAGIRF